MMMVGSVLNKMINLERIVIGTGDKNILITAGIHGDEPSGVYACREFIESYSKEYLQQFRFTIYPCCNQMGFLTGNRFDQEGIDLNRDFTKMPITDEVIAIQKSLCEGPSNYLFVMDLHEDNPLRIVNGFSDIPNGFYIYESYRPGNLRIGPEIIAKVQTDFSVCNTTTIYGDKNSRGIIDTQTNNPDQGAFEQFVFERYSGSVITTETIASWPMRNRIDAQIAAILAALELAKK